jgi:hypothetical protein
MRRLRSYLCSQRRCNGCQTALCNSPHRLASSRTTNLLTSHAIVGWARGSPPAAGWGGHSGDAFPVLRRWRARCIPGSIHPRPQPFRQISQDQQVLPPKLIVQGDRDEVVPLRMGGACSSSRPSRSVWCCWRVPAIATWRWSAASRTWQQGGSSWLRQRPVRDPGCYPQRTGSPGSARPQHPVRSRRSRYQPSAA